MICVRFLNFKMLMSQSFSRNYCVYTIINHILKHNLGSTTTEPSGKHLFTSYCCSVKNYSKPFQALYLKSKFSSESDDLANAILKQNSQLTKNELVQILNLLYTKGFTTEEIKQNYMSYFGPKQNPHLKFKLLSEIRNDTTLVIPLILMPLSTIRLAIKRYSEDKLFFKNCVDRISYLSHELDMDDAEMVKLLCKHPSLLTMKFPRLENKMKILKSANIGAAHIVKDLWIFNYNEKLLAGRIKTASRSGISIKPWLLRCPKEVFYSMIEKWEETQKILDGVDEVSYLAKKLDCNVDYVTHMMEKNKLLKTINVPKLEKVINFLYDKGYTPEEVRLFPRVFCSSVDTLSKRFEDFHGVKGAMPTMSQLCFSSKKYEEFLNKKD